MAIYFSLALLINSTFLCLGVLWIHGKYGYDGKDAGAVLLNAVLTISLPIAWLAWIVIVAWKGFPLILPLN
jgi:hypothetical protein